MRRKTVSGIMLSLLLVGVLILTFNIQPAKAEPKTWTVDDDGPADFHTIQEAINAANPGDTIYVYNGTYYENLVINKTVLLIGEDRESTIIDGSGIPENVVYITANSIKITGFTIRNGWRGIWYVASDDTVISDNIINISRFGICLFSSYGNTISDNIVDYCQGGGCGIDVGDGGGHTIYGNTIKGVRFWTSAGIVVSGSDDNIISANTITTNQHGIWLGMGSNNTIIDNTITNNDHGVQLDFQSSNNKIFHNNFIDNTQQADIEVSGYGNFWDNGYPSGGNYWSDHVCTGNPSDGSQPYIIDADNIDHYPFQNPNGWLLPPPKAVGGKATPINIPINKPETPTLWIWLTTIILSLVLTVVYVKKRKRNT